MTNRQYLAGLSDDDLADWLCKQMWPAYKQDTLLDVVRYNQVRNFLKMEYKEGDELER